MWQNDESRWFVLCECCAAVLPGQIPRTLFRELCTSGMTGMPNGCSIINQASALQSVERFPNSSTYCPRIREITKGVYNSAVRQEEKVVTVCVRRPGGAVQTRARQPS